MLLSNNKKELTALFEHYKLNIKRFGFKIGDRPFNLNYVITGCYYDEDGEFKYSVLCNCGSPEKGTPPHNLSDKTTERCRCGVKNPGLVKPHHKVLRASDIENSDENAILKNIERREDGRYLFIDLNGQDQPAIYRKIVTIKEGFFNANNIEEQIDYNKFIALRDISKINETQRTQGWLSEEKALQKNIDQEVISDIQHQALLHAINKTFQPKVTFKTIYDKFNITDLIVLPREKYKDALNEINKYIK